MMKISLTIIRAFFPSIVLIANATSLFASDWGQLQGDAERSGNKPSEALSKNMGLLGSIALTDGSYAAPVIGNGKVFVIDGSGVVFCIDASTLEVIWRFETKGGLGN